MPTGDFYEDSGSFTDVLNVPQVKPILDKDGCEALRAMCMALDSISRAHDANVLYNGSSYAEKIASAITMMCTMVVYAEKDNG